MNHPAHNRQPLWQMILHMLLPMLLLTITPALLAAKPIRPALDDTIVERLPKQHRVIAADLSMLPTLGNRNTPTNNSLRDTVNRTRHYLALARQYADPRMVGFAQSTLAPWLNTPTPDTEILVLQALVKQADHHFPEALQFLDIALAQQPGHVQALLTRASILQVIGNYPAALRDCKQLVNRVATIISYTCIATTTGLSGQLAKSLSVLQRYIDNTDNLSHEQFRWVISSMADMAERLNNPALAARYYQAAIAEKQADNYINEAYAEFLLQTRQYPQLLEFTQQTPPSDGLLVKRAFAEQQLGDANVPATVKLLKQRFARADARGDQKHLREQAYFYLHVLKKPAKALTLARQNWDHQREPMDTLLYFQAALEQQDNNAIRTIKHWMKQSGFQDERLARLMLNQENRL